ncbi:hypothetical protein FS837_010423 [Tulasnella sp. UAMH 9824]|nr:hypothetical protein FS837_010423 [Tulasnella sp. UAMH 9824]
MGNPPLTRVCVRVLLGVQMRKLSEWEWKDGLQWGPSRTRDDFLFYIQKSPEDGDGKRLKYGRRSQPVVRKESSDVLLSSSPIASSSKPPPLQQAPPPPTISNAGSVEDNKLVKQTYSVYTKLPGDSESRPMRKWHLTAYYTPHAVHSGQLKDITQIPLLANLQVPPNRFKAARIGKRPGATGSENQLPVTGAGPGSAGTTTTSMYASVSPTGEYIAYGDPHHHHQHPHLMGVGAATLEPSRYPPPVVRHTQAPGGGSSSGGSSVASSPLHHPRHGDISPTTSARGHHPHLSWPTTAGSSSPLLPPPSSLGHTPPIPGYSGPSTGGYHPQLYPPSQQPSQYPHPPPAGGAAYPPPPGSYPPPSSQPQYHPYHQPQYSPAPSYPPPPRTTSPLVMSSSPRARISSLPSLASSSSHAQYSHSLPPLPARYPSTYESQVPQYPPASKPYDDLPHSPAESIHSDFGAHDVQMHDASSTGPSAQSGLTTISENRALPPLDISASFQARTAEDERTLWALTKGFGKERK